MQQIRSGGTDVKVGEVMTRGVELASPDDTIQKAASRMAELDTGVLPVGEGDRSVGMLTDRDIAVRAVAQGRGPDTKVREAMTPDVRYCFEDDDLDAVGLRGRERPPERAPFRAGDNRQHGRRDPARPGRRSRPGANPLTPARGGGQEGSGRHTGEGVGGPTDGVERA
jgi:hypothetical protein